MQPKATSRDSRSEPSLLSASIDPLYLALGCLVAACVIMLISYGGLSKSDAPDKSQIYLVSASFVLIYVIFNSILSYGIDNMAKYLPRSIIGFVGLTVISTVVAQLLSGVAIDDAGTYKWLYIVFSMCYIIFLVIVRTMRKIIDLAQEQDKNLRNER